MDDNEPQRWPPDGPPRPGAATPGANWTADPLLQPTVAPPAHPGPAPWRTSSMVYVGFLGGPLAVGLLAVINAGRLRAPRQTSLIIAFSSVVLLGAWVAFACALADAGGPSLRVINIACGVVMHLVQSRLLASQTRVFEMSRREPASMWLPGLGAVIASVVVSSLVLAATGTPQL